MKLPLSLTSSAQKLVDHPSAIADLRQTFYAEGEAKAKGLANKMTQVVDAIKAVKNHDTEDIEQGLVLAKLYPSRTVDKILAQVSRLHNRRAKKVEAENKRYLAAEGKFSGLEEYPNAIEHLESVERTESEFEASKVHARLVAVKAAAEATPGSTKGFVERCLNFSSFYPGRSSESIVSSLAKRHL
ncbi:hypothetical protein [Puniceicoccus vermicola]|uniref:Uncharacterized protein n=1 Tax=Puniceicoccus vermicola TaxID=388746 RepID=A0A7X1AXC8_9BACT|nr:hypothetical protein [Puniceicoccus vermicola]MBC2601765.1 hypothetical protein [Puniceicoccus vermicola]